MKFIIRLAKTRELPVTWNWYKDFSRCGSWYWSFSWSSHIAESVTYHIVGKL